MSTKVTLDISKYPHEKGEGNHREPITVIRFEIPHVHPTHMKKHPKSFLFKVKFMASRPT
jgi:hypothetical protein